MVSKQIQKRIPNKQTKVHKKTKFRYIIEKITINGELLVVSI